MCFDKLSRVLLRDGCKFILQDRTLMMDSDFWSMGSPKCRVFMLCMLFLDCSL